MKLQKLPASLDKAKSSMAGLEVKPPENFIEQEFCNLVLEGCSSKETAEALGLAAGVYSKLVKKLKGFIYQWIYDHRKSIWADNILRATQKIKEWEDKPDQKGNKYIAYLRLRNDMLRGMVDGDTAPPVGSLIVFMDDEGKEITLGAGNQKITIADGQPKGGTEVIIDGTATTSGQPGPVQAAQVPEAGSGEPDKDNTGE